MKVRENESYVATGRNLKGGRLLKNYVSTFVYQLISFLVPLVTTPYLSRVFSADGIGIQSFVNAVVAYFVVFASLGTAVYGAREIARTRDEKEECSRVFWEIVIFKTITTIICIAAWIIYVFISKKYSVFYAVATTQIIATVFDITWFYEGHEMFVSIAIRNTIVKILNVIYIFSMVNSKDDLGGYILSIGVFALIGNLSLWFTLSRYLTKVRFRSLRIFRHVKDTLVYFLPTVATLVYTVLDKVMIGVMTGIESENGYYEQAEKIVRLGTTITCILPNVMTTRMSYLFAKGGREEILEKMYKGLDCCVFLGLPMVFGMWGISSILVPWFLGDGFEKVVMLIYILCPLILIIGLSGTVGRMYLTPSGQRARSTKAIIGGAITNFVMNLVLIPHFASVGAAVASVAGEMVVTGMYFYMSKDYISVWRFVGGSWKKLVAAVVMYMAISGGVFIGLGISLKTTVFRIIAGAVVYAVMLLVLRDKTMMNLIKNWLCRQVTRSACDKINSPVAKKSELSG